MPRELIPDPDNPGQKIYPLLMTKEELLKESNVYQISYRNIFKIHADPDKQMIAKVGLDVLEEFGKQAKVLAKLNKCLTPCCWSRPCTVTLGVLLQSMPLNESTINYFLKNYCKVKSQGLE